MQRVPPKMSEDEYMLKLASKDQTPEGSEKPDSTPMEPPVGYERRPSMFDRMREMVKVAMAERMQREVDGDADAEDEEDFGDDEFEPISSHQYSHEDEVFIRQTVEERNKSIDEAKRKKAAAATPPAPPARPDA